MQGILRSKPCLPAAASQLDLAPAKLENVHRIIHLYEEMTHDIVNLPEVTESFCQLIFDVQLAVNARDNSKFAELTKEAENLFVHDVYQNYSKTSELMENLMRASEQTQARSIGMSEAIEFLITSLENKYPVPAPIDVCSPTLLSLPTEILLSKIPHHLPSKIDFLSLLLTTKTSAGKLEYLKLVKNDKKIAEYLATSCNRDKESGETFKDNLTQFGFSMIGQLNCKDRHGNNKKVETILETAGKLRKKVEEETLRLSNMHYLAMNGLKTKYLPCEYPGSPELGVITLEDFQLGIPTPGMRSTYAADLCNIKIKMIELESVIQRVKLSDNVEATWRAFGVEHSKKQQSELTKQSVRAVEKNDQYTMSMNDPFYDLAANLTSNPEVAKKYLTYTRHLDISLRQGILNKELA